MFREMRRKAQQLPESECVDILKEASSGVLAVTGDDGYPYTVPLSFVYDESRIYFHCAKSGHKLDAIKKESKVSFCVIHQDDVVQQKFTTRYKSVVVFAKAQVLTNEDEKLRAVTLLAEKYSPDYKNLIPKEIEDGFAAMEMVALDIEHMTGKEGLELTKERKNL